MMDSLRKFAAGWVAKILIGLLVIAFGIWGISDVFRGFGQQDLAQIGPVKISVENFRVAYNNRLQQLSRQLRRPISGEQARAIGLDRQLLGEMVADTALDARVRELGLGIGDNLLLQMIRGNELFHGPDGQFDPNQFAILLRDNGYTEARFLDAERRLILRRQLIRALTGEMPAPRVLADAANRFQNEQRSVEFVALGRDQAGEVPQPTQEQLAAFFESRKASFRAPEYRAITVLALVPETLAETVKISDGNVRSAFEQRRDRLAIPERREIEQIVFPNMEEASAAAKRIAAGEKFEEVAKARGLSAGDIALGMVAKRDILDKAVADAAFALPAGQISEPVKGRFGIVLIRVNKIEPGKEPAFAEVADALRKELALDRARRDIFDLHDKIEDERASGATLAELAKKLNLKVISVPAIDRSGRSPEGKLVEEIPAREQVVAGAFETQVGIETDPIEDRNSGAFIWYEVNSITPSRDRSLTEVKERVETRWRDEEIAKRLAERAEAIRTRLDAGDSFGAAAGGLQVQKREQLQRGQPVDNLDARAIDEIFQAAQGKAGIAAAPDGIGRIVFRVTAVTLPTGTGDPQLAARIGAGLQEDILVQYVQRLQNNLGVWVNEEALRRVTGADTGN